MHVQYALVCSHYRSQPQKFTHIVKTNGGHGVQCVASLCSFVSAFCCLFVAVKALVSSEEVMASRFYKRICADESL